MMDFELSGLGLECFRIRWMVYGAGKADPHGPAGPCQGFQHESLALGRRQPAGKEKVILGCRTVKVLGMQGRVVERRGVNAAIDFEALGDISRNSKNLFGFREQS